MGSCGFSVVSDLDLSAIEGLAGTFWWYHYKTHLKYKTRRNQTAIFGNMLSRFHQSVFLVPELVRDNS